MKKSWELWLWFLFSVNILNLDYLEFFSIQDQTVKMNSPNYMDQNLPKTLNEFHLELQQKIIYEKLTTYRSLFDLNCV